MKIKHLTGQTLLEALLYYYLIAVKHPAGRPIIGLVHVIKRYNVGIRVRKNQKIAMRQYIGKW